MTDQDTTFDFQDGNGPVPASMHPNGGGWVAHSANASSDAYIGPDAAVGGEASLWPMAEVTDHARVHGKTVLHPRAVIRGSAVVTGEAEVYELMCISGNDRVTRTPLLVRGDFPIVTITDHAIRTGCQELLTPSEWEVRGAASIRSSRRFTREQVAEWPKMIAMLAKSHGCTDP